jgi:hypothetical protein
MHFRSNAETPPEFALLHESLRLPSDMKTPQIVGSVPQARWMRGVWPLLLLGYSAGHLTIVRTGALIPEFPDSGRSPVRIRGTAGRNS